MPAIARHWKAHDWRLLGLVGVNLICIGLFLAAGRQAARQDGAGWRRIDRAALEQRIDSGDLTGREAQWYHPTRPDERTLQPAGR